MHVIDLAAATQIMVNYGVDAVDITIKGKASNIISFSATSFDYPIIHEMCTEHGWEFHTSHDQFLNAEMQRYQLNIGD